MDSKVYLLEKVFRVERGNTAETYQGLTLKAEFHGARRYLTLELDNLNRWRSQDEYADYLRWAADQIEALSLD